MLTGFILSIIYKTPEFKKVAKYEWEMPDYDPINDKFMQRFDDNGNFVNLPVVVEEELIISYFSIDLPVNYVIVVNEKNESKPES